MADITFLIDFVTSIAAVAVPIIVIVLLLADGDFTVADLFILPSQRDLGAGPAEEETPPRWRPERLRAHQPNVEPRPRRTATEARPSTSREVVTVSIAGACAPQGPAASPSR